MPTLNFNPKQRAWLMLVALVLGTGCGVVVTSYLGGAKLWVSILCGVGTAASNVYHALSDSPEDK